jgi:hypothetical protein
MRIHHHNPIFNYVIYIGGVDAAADQIIAKAMDNPFQSMHLVFFLPERLEVLSITGIYNRVLGAVDAALDLIVTKVMDMSVSKLLEGTLACGHRSS